MGTAAFAVPAFSISAGVGGLFNAGLGGDFDMGLGGSKISTSQTYLGGGGFAFLDATFVELGVGFAYNSQTSEATTEITGFPSVTAETTGSFTAIDISLLGKYPFELGPVVLFPLVGADYKLVLSSETEGNNDDDASDQSIFGILAGVGADYSLTDALYLRCEFIYNIFLPSTSKTYEDLIDADIDIGLIHGPTVKLAVGYKFL
jgi:opacity protein-like surface antigen